MGNKKNVWQWTWLAAGMWILAVPFSLEAQQKTPAHEIQTPDDRQAELFEKFRKTLSGSKLVGSFTVTGRDLTDLTPEEYHIKDVRKMEPPDMWMITARVKYGNNDYTIPFPLEVKWAGETPVITVNNFAIPGQGSVGARVVIYDKKYAGTWSHNRAGGHLFGEIVPDAAEDSDDQPNETPDR